MRGLTITPAVLAPIGLALVVFESVQALRSVKLQGLGQVLLFGGLGLLVVAATLVVVSLWIDAEPSTDAESAPADAVVDAAASDSAASPAAAEETAQ
jgi:hypothetical protein